MKSRYFALILALFVSFSSVLAFTYEVEIINGVAEQGEDLEYKITFASNDGPQEDLTISCSPLYTLFVPLKNTGTAQYTTCSIEPAVFSFWPFNTQEVIIRIGVPENAYPSWSELRQVTKFSILVKDSYHDISEGIELTAKINGEVPKEIVEVEVPINLPPDYSKVIVDEIDFPVIISDTRPPYELTMEINNELRDRLESEVEIKIMRDEKIIDTIIETITIGGLDKTTYSKLIKLDDKLTPGEYSIEITLLHEENVIINENILFDVSGYSDIIISENEILDITGKTVEIIIENDGTKSGSEQVEVPMNWFEKLLSVGGLGGAEFTGNAIVWDIPLDSGESKKVGYKISFIPIFITPFLIAGVLYMLWWNNRGVVIVKNLEEKQQEEHATSGKMSIKFKNVTGKPFRDIKIIEEIPEFVSHVGEFSPIKPEVKKMKKGHRLVWKIGQMAPKEERIFTYKMKTKLGLLGKINLPASTIKFYSKKGKLKVRKSNPIEFLGEYKN